MAAENNQESIVSHLNADTDSSAVAIHHTLGPLPFQASPGSHVHDGKDSHKIDYNSLLNLPDIGGGAAEYTSTVKHEVKLGSAILKGQAVYVSSADGTNMIVSKASNASEATSSKTMGLLESGGATNAKVNVITEGLLAGLNTSTATAGDPVWLGTDGNLLYGLANKPHAPAHMVFIGIVTRSNSSNGEIFVRPQNGFELDELHDVLISSPAAGEVIQRTSSNLWENKTLAEAGIAAADHNHTGVYAPAAHTHDDRYYTEDETDALLDGKSNTGHTHDDRYYLDDEVDDLLAAKSDNNHNHDGVYLKLSDTATQNLSGNIDMNNSNILGVNSIQLEDNGPTEGFLFPAAGATASGWKIVETDTTLTANNAPGDIQFVAGSTPARKVTIDTNGAIEAVSTVKGTQLISTTTTPGQPPLVVASTVNVPNLNADMLDGQHASAFAASSHSHTIANVTGLQAELDSKLNGTFATGDRVLVTTAEGDVATSGTIDTTELGYLNGVTSSIQTQLNNKIDETPTEIGNAANLHDYVTTGLWIQSSNAEAAAGTNYPAPYAGALEVVARDDGAFVFQRYTTYQPYNKVYHRSKYTGTWSTWKEVTNVGHGHEIAEINGLVTVLADKADEVHTHAISDVTGLQTALDDKALAEGYTANRVLISNGVGAIGVSTTIDTTELGYLNGVTSNIQTQLNDKAALSAVTDLQTAIDGKENESLFKYENADTLKMSSISTSTTASVFGTNGVAVEGSTTYFVEGVIFFTAGVVGTSATHSLGWGSPSGAATVTRNSMFWDYNSSTTALTLAAATSGVKRTGSTTFQPLNTITMTGTHYFRGAFSGLITFNAAGNFTPRLTVTPTSASVDLTVNQGSFIKLTKVATGATLTNGTWA